MLLLHPMRWLQEVLYFLLFALHPFQPMRHHGISYTPQKVILFSVTISVIVEVVASVHHLFNFYV